MLVLRIPFANSAKYKLETANQLVYSRTMKWTTKIVKICSFRCWKVEHSSG